MWMLTDLCSEVGGYCPVLRGTPVVVVRVGAYLLLLFVFVAGMTEIPTDRRSRSRVSGWVVLWSQWSH